MSQTASENSNTLRARRLAQEVVSRDGTRLTEALLADAIGHLADELDALRERLDRHDRSLRSAFDAIGP